MLETSFFTDTDFTRYRTLVYNESGIHFTTTNRSILESRIKEQLREKHIGSVQDYYTLITNDKAELQNFLDSITTNLTRFFRNQAHFDMLQDYVVPELMKFKKDNHTIKIWSAGCSTGEEPYTIAMVLQNILPLPWHFEIIASDLSLKCLMVGKEGFYSDNQVEGIPSNYLTKYFDHVAGGYKIHKDLVSKVRFDYHNLKHDPGFRNFDVVFCRNVIIYFDEVAQVEVINRFWQAMSLKSFLFIGHSESLFGMDTQFEFVKTKWGTLYQKSV
ncbi:MAG: protein-glutamate O-methyltransferase CheR [Treponema sp.]|jgi:chemotaxis protein methyltransferase CheR|nr:protein-glutamate O-methyltransferase CheR [Treponema sp.]